MMHRESDLKSMLLIEIKENVLFLGGSLTRHTLHRSNMRVIQAWIRQYQSKKVWINQVNQIDSVGVAFMVYLVHQNGEIQPPIPDVCNTLASIFGVNTLWST